MTTVYLLDTQSVFVGAQEVDPYGPLPFCTLTVPPATTGTEVAQWTGVEWAVLPAYPVPPAPPLPSNAEQRAARQFAYEKEADPIYFMAQREEATQEEWQAKIAEIKARYPYHYDEQGNLIQAQE